MEINQIFIQSIENGSESPNVLIESITALEVVYKSEYERKGISYVVNG